MIVASNGTVQFCTVPLLRLWRSAEQKTLPMADLISAALRRNRQWLMSAKGRKRLPSILDRKGAHSRRSLHPVSMTVSA